MKLGIIFAVALHAGFILFGGLLFASHADDKAARGPVELVGSETPQAKDDKKDKDKDKKDATEEKNPEDVKPEEEKAPDSAELSKSLDLSPAAAAPALDTGSLSAMSDALNGTAGGGGDFGRGFNFASGGVVGGRGKAGSAQQESDNGFGMGEIDQKPRAIMQGPPVYPSEMRGKSVEGAVSVFFVVDPSGKVTSPRVEKSSNQAFERPALDAVKQWKFEPAVKAGQRVACKMRVSIRFQKS